MNNTRTALLKTLEYFPITGFFIKWIMDVATNDSMTATSSIIRNSCISLYLACMLWVLAASESSVPKFGIFVVFTLLLVYVSSIAMNASYITLINSGNVDLKSESFWVFAEIVILFKFMYSYVLNQASETWLIGLLLVMLPHAWIVVTNFMNMRVRPTDDVIQNIKPVG